MLSTQFLEKTPVEDFGGWVDLLKSCFRLAARSRKFFGIHEAQQLYSKEISIFEVAWMTSFQTPEIFRGNRLSLHCDFRVA